MDRRDFLKTTLAAFVTAMVPMERDKKGDSLVLGGFVAEEENFLHYLIPKGVMTFDDGIVGLLFQDLVMSVRVGKKAGPPSPDVDCMFGKVVAPLPVATVFYHRLGDVGRTNDNVLKVGVLREDGSHLWFKLAKPCIDGVGVSVATVNPTPTEGMQISEFTHMVAYSEPEICEKPTITPGPITEAMLKEANPDWPNVIDLHEHLVDRWRQYDGAKV